ncbi:MAG: DUF481 domain-containing protein [Deltaproteobacteria bacterium]|nr:MAG: DUF481 domain-containing protein [Deltaproteobacteria bacterium]
MYGAHLLVSAQFSALLAVATDGEPPQLPQGTIAAQPASTGVTEVPTGKFAAAAPKPSDDTSKDATELDLQTGGLLSTGNARSFAVTGALNFRLRRKAHQVSSIAAVNYGRSVPSGEDGWKTTVKNVQGMARYDGFVHEHVSLFTMLTARHDTFQGLKLRLNVDPGVAFHALTKPKHRLWFEVGYDFQYDLRTDEAIVVKDDEGNPVLDDDGDPKKLDKELLNHAVRLFGGYSNRMSDYVSFETGLEYLQSVQVGRRFRVNWNSALAVTVTKWFSLATTFTLRYENQPLPDVEKLDTITSFNLVFHLVPKASGEGGGSK